MVKYIVYTKDTRIRDVDYLFENPDKFMALLPYLKKKIDGEWRIALFEPPIKYVRRVIDEEFVPEYVTLELYLERSVVEQILLEKPSLAVKTKTSYEKYMDMIADMKVLIDPKAAKELYRRVGVNKDKLGEYLMSLSESAQEGVITVNQVRQNVVDERVVYASDVMTSFLLRDRWRWKKYSELVKTLGQEYAYYALRKYTEKLLADKNKYLRNEDTEIRTIDKIDAFKINQAYILFHTTTSKELDLCMYLLDNRELMRRIIC